MIRFSMMQSYAVITSVNQRLEKKGPDGKDVGIDIDFDAVVQLDVLNDLAVGCIVDYRAMFYDDEGNVQPTGVEKLVFGNKYEDHRFILSLDNISQQNVILPDVKIKKFSAVFDANYQVKLHFQIRCHPSDEALLFFRQAQIKDSVLVEIQEPAQIDLIDDEKN